MAVPKILRRVIFAISATISNRKTVRYYGIQNISSHIVRTELGVDDEYFTVISCIPNSKYFKSERDAASTTTYNNTAQAAAKYTPSAAAQ